MLLADAVAVGIRVAVHHRTVYRYDRLVRLGPHVVRLRPTPHAATAIASYALHVAPASHFINWQQDPHGNFLARLVFPEPTRELAVTVDLIADLRVINPFDFFLEPSAESFPFAYDPALAEEIEPFRRCLATTARMRALLDSIDRRPHNTVDVLVELNRRLQREITYVIRMEPGVQTPDETLASGCGSCRDTAWLFVQLLRQLGFAARFVSGYLVQLVPDVRPADGPPGPSADFTDLHAWTEVYLPGAGWVGLDPTSGLLAGEGHIPLACTPDPGSAAPITGAVDRSEVEFDFHMSVERLHEDPRVTKPYSEAAWAAITALGRRVDTVLGEGDVRLSMGGEPTFVSIDDPDGAEWNTAALGPTKRRLAGRLLRRLRDHFAPGSLLHFGQGKWYPGESLPRWALGCYWRRDGEPIWTDPELIAADDVDYGVGAADAERFIIAIAEQLGVNPGAALPAYEDAWYYLWRERRLPLNVDPLESRLDDPDERARLAGVLERGLGAVVGWALPLAPGPRGWRSGRWSFRPTHMFLLPGDSPMGFRLPLDSLPWLAADDRRGDGARDPFADRPPLPPHTRWAHRIGPPPPSLHQGIAEQTPSPADIVRTALCVEPREGRLHVFVPPLDLLEDHLALIAAIEAAARRLRTPIQVEGYTPPQDHRLGKLEVTPDPGVIEVNIHPALGWDELAASTEALYAAARECRLGTEKFMLDGRHTGTGGGNHLTLGGPTPADSPFLRRPDLLRSLLGYWHNHPALSYLLSGLFIGPTSQAPRVDEARDDALYELETAFAHTPTAGTWQPWLVDRLFRNLLADVTGNTHRAEFCIDKLYAPDSARGRLGLVEMRAFEMPPHARMSCVQQLLVRALVARFWAAPYRAPLERWGTTLHDRFLLPHFVWQDFADVLADCAAAGFPLEPEWFAPHFEFRFPPIGTFVRAGVQLELRTALEPWHVLAEEPGAGGTVRYVDSSVERLQVKATNFVGGRYAVTCNGVAVPLHPTGTAGEYVAGVRYRAWQPPSALHPTIPVDAPLCFELVDTWLGRSLGGATYHVAHPGGRNYETFPVNANEAEARRSARFTPLGHTAGPLAPAMPPPAPEYPLTVDLRRV
jgi:uncharacterized protein (DUF2126 family)/transglutaminase-like putative cysteine protease